MQPTDKVFHPISGSAVSSGRRGGDGGIGGFTAPSRPLASVIRRRRWSVLVVTALVVSTVAALTLTHPKTYESTTTILVEERNRSGDSPALEVLERLGQGSQAETEIELLGSRRVIEPVVDELDLHVGVETARGSVPAKLAFPDFVAGRDAIPGVYRISQSANGGFVVWSADPDSTIAHADAGSRIEFAGIRLTLPAASAWGDAVLRIRSFSGVVAEVQGRMSANRVRRESDLISLRCKAPRPESARDLCDAVSAAYMRLRTSLQRDEASATAEFLRVQVQQIKIRLAAAEDSLEAFGRQNQVVALKERAAEEVRQLASLQAQREQLEAERFALAQLIQRIERDEGAGRKYRDLATFPTFLKSQAVTQLLGNLITLEDRRGELALLRTERNADLIALDSRIADLELQLRGVAVSYETALAAQIGSLDGTLTTTGKRLSVIPAQQVQFARLERQASLFDELYKFLETRRREAEVAEAVELPSVTVVDVASLPSSPAAPKPVRNVGLAMVLGLAGGVCLALFRELADTRFHERHELEAGTGRIILGMIPTVDRDGPLLPLRRSEGPDHEGYVYRRPEAAPTWDQQLALEAFRSLVADLRFIGRDIGNGGVRSVAITSAGPGEGKTFVSCNLALARAIHAGRTMLVDADMRASRVAEFFGFRGRPGLSEVLAGTVSAREVTETLRVDEVGQLWVIPAGTPTLYSAALLEEQLFDRLISLVEKNVDLLIIDTPPLNVLTDASTIASSVDAVLVVVRRGLTDRDALDLTLERLSRTGVQHISVVFNDVVMPKQFATYTYRYTPGGGLGDGNGAAKAT